MRPFSASLALLVLVAFPAAASEQQPLEKHGKREHLKKGVVTKLQPAPTYTIAPQPAAAPSPAVGVKEGSGDRALHIGEITVTAGGFVGLAVQRRLRP